MVRVFKYQRFLKHTNKAMNIDKRQRQMIREALTERLSSNMVQIKGYVYPFRMNKFQLTQEEYCAIMDIDEIKVSSVELEGARFPYFTDKWVMYSKAPNKGQKTKAISDLLEALNKLTSHHFRLPTVNEWEFVASCGGKYPDLTNEKYYHREVGMGEPNELGIYNMFENGLHLCSVIPEATDASDLFYIGKGGNKIDINRFDVTNFYTYDQRTFLPATIRLVESEISLNNIAERHPEIERDIERSLDRSEDRYEEYRRDWEH